MSDTNEPLLPEGYYWQFVNAEGNDCTGTPIYAVQDAVEARVWHESGDLILSLVDSNDARGWHQESSGTGGLPIERTFQTLDEAVEALTL